MESNRVVMAVFTGTGNTLVVSRVLSDELSRGGRHVSVVAMDSREPFVLPDDAALGIAMPVACFSTYPTAWRFLDALPEGRGREAFFLASMGGVSFGMEGAIRRVVERKGYRPIGAMICKMPSNYGNKTIPTEENSRLVLAAERSVARYAHALLTGEAKWGGGGMAAGFFAWLGHTRTPWRAFYRMFPLAVDADKCVGCGLCRELCPEENITLTAEGVAAIGNHCQSCQRCIGFCPKCAISVPNKPAERYQGAPIGELRTLLKR